MKPVRALCLLLLTVAAVGFLGCSSDSDTAGEAQRAAEDRRAQVRAQQHAAHSRALARRQARIRARRKAAHQAAVFQEERADQRQAEAEEAEALRSEEESAEEASSECDPNYSGACLSPTASDYDCEGGSGDGPEFTGTVTVTGEDHHGLDSDSDGTGCEPE